VTVHHASPYEHDPADYPADPFLRRVSPIWRHRSSVFGPLWVGYSAIGAAVADESVLASRLYFQLTAAAAAAAALALVWRRSRSPAALVWLGLHPVFGAVAVNGGHNDLVIGLAVLVAVLLFARRRPVVAGVVIGLAALVKLTALLALIGFAVWAVRHRRRRQASLAIAGAAGTVALGYAPVFLGAWHVLSGADRTVTPASLWNPVADFLLGHNSYRDVANPLATNGTLLVISYLSLALVVALAVGLGWRAARSRRASAAVGTAVAAYPFAAAYTFPWYGCWALPTFADAGPSPLAWVVWLQTAAMLAALKLPIHWQGTILDGSVRVALTFVTPVAMLLLLVAAARRHDPTPRCSPSPA
jgi:alpha-1,6-mannosyltransferase